MRVACNRCQVKFDVPEGRLAAGAVKVRCSECGNTFVVRRRSRPSEASGEETSPVESPLDRAGIEGFDEPAGDAAPTPEASFNDFDFAGFKDGDAPDEPPPAADADDPGIAGPADVGNPLPSIGELDLGDFGGLDDDLSHLEELDLGSLADELSGDVMEFEEPLERVREEDLVSSAPVKGSSSQGLAEDLPRLDIQRGPRRSKGGAKSPVIARDRRHSPLLWVVIVVAVATLGFSGFLFYTKRDAALTFLNPSHIRQLWQRRAMEAKLEAVELQGYYKDLPADRRVFVIQGSVTNRSQDRQSLIKVRGELFGPDGASVISSEVFCGNVLSENELATLPLATIAARLQNEVGEGLRNVDIAPKAKVPFMVVFPSPPADVAKFNVTVTEAQAGSGS